MSMCRKLGAQMNAKAAATILLLLLVGCHAFSAQGTDEVDGSGGGRRELDEGSSKAGVAGLCIASPCSADPSRTCACCTRLANEPCFDTLRQCLSACPNCNFLVCPPPVGSAGAAIGVTSGGGVICPAGDGPLIISVRRMQRTQIMYSSVVGWS